jgi:hypothetical protein
LVVNKQNNAEDTSKTKPAVAAPAARQVTVRFAPAVTKIESVYVDTAGVVKRDVVAGSAITVTLLGGEGRLLRLNTE